MQHVKTEWLKAFNYALVALSSVLCLAYFVFESTGASQNVKDRWGITPLILALATIHATYVFFSHKFIMKKQPWLAGLISIALYSFLIASIIESSGNTNIIYRAVFIISVFFTGMLGLYAPLTAIIFTWMLLIFTITGVATPTNASLTFNIIVDVLVTFAGLAGWMFFKKYYVASEKESVLESELAAEQFKTEAILESINDGVLAVDMKNIIQISNVSAAQMLGWTKDEVLNLDFHSLLKPLDEKSESNSGELDAISLTIQTGQPTHKVSKLETINNRQIYVDIVASPIYQNIPNKDGKLEKTITGVIAVLRDVDKQKRQEQQRSDFISTASHEMRTPVASIQGYLELALNPKISNLDTKTKSYLDKAYEATKHLGQLFQDLLTVSQTEDGRLANHPRIIDVNKLLKEISEGQSGAASRKNLSLNCNLHSGDGGEKTVEPLLYVQADPERLREVITNLVENAIKYTPTGSITIKSSLKDDSVIISVEDTGSGIAEEDIPHLFQKFYRVDNTATREIGGTGLGLYLAKQIIELLDGKIWVESKLDEGSKFFVELPRVLAEDVEKVSQQPPTQAV